MKKHICFMTVLFLVLLLSGCSMMKSEWPDNLIDIRTNIAESKIDFHINSKEDEAIQYTVLYNDRIYKTYTKSEKDWSILYDYSFKDVTKVTIRATAAPDRNYEKSILVVIEPDGFDFTKNTLDIYFASHYGATIDEIAALGEHLVSVDLQGSLPTGDISGLDACKRLERLSLIACSGITGEVDSLTELKALEEVFIGSDEN